MLDSRIKISFIVPIYNTSKFLSRCIDSLIFQTLTEIEIILLDNASTDGSLQICYDYQLLDKRISVYELDRIGVSRSRNKGLDIARGEYIGFVDSDDYLLSNFAYEMYSLAIQQNSALVCCGVTKVSYDNRFQENHLPDVGKIGHKFFKQHADIRNPVWNKIFKRSVIDKYQVRFPDRAFYVEDYAFVIMFYFAIKNKKMISYVVEPLYRYRQHSSSMMSSLYSNLSSSIRNLMVNLENIESFLIQNNIEQIRSKFFKQVVNYYISELPLWLIKQSLLHGNLRLECYRHLIKLFFIYQRRYGHYMRRVDKLIQIEHVCKVRLLYKAKLRHAN